MDISDFEGYEDKDVAIALIMALEAMYKVVEPITTGKDAKDQVEFLAQQLSQVSTGTIPEILGIIAEKAFPRS